MQSKKALNLNLILKISEIQIIISCLKKFEGKDLYYHNHQHTLDVIKQTYKLAKLASLKNREILLLVIAAAYHDAGCLINLDNHEKFSVIIFNAAFKSSSLITSSEKKIIKEMIINTRYPKNLKAKTKLVAYLLDADVANFGRKDFFQKTKAIIKERKIINTAKFYQELETMLKRHKWLTKAAKILWDKQKQKNLLKLEKINAKN